MILLLCNFGPSSACDWKKNGMNKALICIGYCSQEVVVAHSVVSRYENAHPHAKCRIVVIFPLWAFSSYG